MGRPQGLVLCVCNFQPNTSSLTGKSNVLKIMQLKGRLSDK